MGFTGFYLFLPSFFSKVFLVCPIFYVADLNRKKESEKKLKPSFFLSDEPLVRDDFQKFFRSYLMRWNPLEPSERRFPSYHTKKK